MSRWIQAQGAYYVVGGLWPLLHLRSFEAITGPKPDRFVTEAAGALYAAIGAALLLSNGPAQPAARRLGLVTGLATAATELRHRRRIRWVYLADAAVECAFVAASSRSGTALS